MFAERPGLAKSLLLRAVRLERTATPEGATRAQMINLARVYLRRALELVLFSPPGVHP